MAKWEPIDPTGPHQDRARIGACARGTCNGLTVGLCTQGEVGFSVPTLVDCKKK